MMQRLIVPAALLVLSACGESPTAPASGPSYVRHDANPGIGSGVGLLPPPVEAQGTPGSGSVADNAGIMGSGYLVQPDASGENGGGYMGSGLRTDHDATAASAFTVGNARTEPQDDAGGYGGSMGGGGRAERTAEENLQPGSSDEDAVAGGILGSGT